jgi:L-alanine-DL-glutamate epimerase-like enolase superfamily enzyme
VRAVVRAEAWSIRGGFRIARGARRTADVVVLELHHGGVIGRAECVPYSRYGESVDSVQASIESRAATLEVATARSQIQSMPPGAARNALDCAIWDLEAKRDGAPVWSLAGLPAAPAPVRTMRTISVASPTEMGAAARALRGAEVIKVKVDGGPDLERITAVHEAAPKAKLVVDPNEGWSVEQTAAWLPALGELGVAVLEQPVPAREDEALEALRERSVAICADESFHDRGSFEAVAQRYDMVNLKLDKSGGLTEALYCVREAERLGIPIMVGCMVCTSLGVEPALLLAPYAAFVDLDGPLLLESDRDGALHDRDAGILRPSPSIWGTA